MQEGPAVSSTELRESSLQAGCGGYGPQGHSQELVGPGRLMSATHSYRVVRTSYNLTERACWQSLYSNHIHVNPGLTLHMPFTHPVPAPNMRTLAATSPGRPDAGGSCRELSSQKEASLQSGFPLAAF